MFSPSSPLEFENAIGFVKFYGFSPSIDLSKHKKNETSIFQFGNCDLRHMMTSLNNFPKDFNSNVQFVFPEENKWNFLRNLVLFHIINLLGFLFLALTVRLRILE